MFGKKSRSKIIIATLKRFGIKATLSDTWESHQHQTYELEVPDEQVLKIPKLVSNLEFALGSSPVRIKLGSNYTNKKSEVTIEVPLEKKEFYSWNEHSMVVHGSNTVISIPKGGSIPIGISQKLNEIIEFEPDIDGHILLAGETGSGKSIFMHSFIASTLNSFTLAQPKFVLFDPKLIEFTPYRGKEYLLRDPSLDDKNSIYELGVMVKEIQIRQSTIQQLGVSSIYNAMSEIPSIFLLIDELSDITRNYPEALELIHKIVTDGAAVGVHLVAGTSIPMREVFGDISRLANKCMRVAFRLGSSRDSEFMLGEVGAEKLIGNGDAIMVRPNKPGSSRFQTIFTTVNDVLELPNPQQDLEVRSRHVERYQQSQLEVDDKDDWGSGTVYTQSHFRYHIWEEGREERIASERGKIFKYLRIPFYIVALLLSSILFPTLILILFVDSSLGSKIQTRFGTVTWLVLMVLLPSILWWLVVGYMISLLFFR